MFFHLSVFLQSALFTVVVAFGSGKAAGEYLTETGLGGALLAAAALFLGGWYFGRVAQRLAQRRLLGVLPILLLPAAIASSLLVDDLVQRKMLAFIAGAVYYAIALGALRIRGCAKDQTARSLLAAATIATMFLVYASAYGIYLNFAISLGILLLVLAAATALATFQYLSLLSEDRSKVRAYAALSAMLMLEAFWGLSLWPFGYLTTGVIALIFYYVLWDTIQCHLAQMPLKGRVIANVSLLVVLASAVLATTRWIPVV
ncbi:MAG TPA: hypothetical protein PKA31_02200 [Candidatus Moranbacteria bacterium]|nr:hypothetical protein [Candidatus Moranbacteria bacterium]